MALELIPVGITEAKRFVGKVHRHNGPPVSGLFAVGVRVGGQLRGVAIAGRPVARPLDDGRTIEVTRLGTDGVRNGCSMLYAAICRAAKALGYRLAYTYTLAEEPGASLRAAGWVIDAELPARESWDTPGRRRVQRDMFGADRRPPGPKVRWRKELSVSTENDLRAAVSTFAASAAAPLLPHADDPGRSPAIPDDPRAQKKSWPQGRRKKGVEPE